MGIFKFLITVTGWIYFISWKIQKSYIITIQFEKFQMQEAIIPATDSKSIFSVIFLVFIDSSIELDIST